MLYLPIFASSNIWNNFFYINFTLTPSEHHLCDLRTPCTVHFACYARFAFCTFCLLLILHLYILSVVRKVFWSGILVYVYIFRNKYRLPIVITKKILNFLYLKVLNCSVLLKYKKIEAKILLYTIILLLNYMSLADLDWTRYRWWNQTLRLFYIRIHICIQRKLCILKRINLFECNT